MKKRIKWENIICPIVVIVSVILYIIATKDIELKDSDINSFRLFWIINIVFIIINMGNLLLYKSIKNSRR